MKRLLLAIAISTIAATANAAGIGTWRNYLAYSDITDVQQAGTTLFVLASGGLYSYNTNDESITTYDKVNALSDCGIQLIAWCQEAARLVIVYDNGNIDLMSRDGQVTNMPDYYNYSTTLDKTIYGLDVIGSHAYLSTAFGVVDLNVGRAEVSGAYQLGFRVDYVYSAGGRIYAASSTNGTFSAAMTDNLLDPASWTYATSYTPRPKSIDPELLATAETLKPGGPKYNYFSYMTYQQDRLYTCGGYFLSGVADAMRPGTIQVLDGDEWSLCQENVGDITGYTYQNVNSLAVDPADPGHLFAGGQMGMYEFKDGLLTNHFSFDNSPLEGAMDGSTELTNHVVLVHSMLFDKSGNGNLWLLNSQARTNSLMEYTKDGQFVKHDQAQLMGSSNSMPGMMGMMYDSRGLMWFVNNHSGSPSIICYQQENDAMNVYGGQFYNQNGERKNLNFVRCIAEDHDGNMWVGTDLGPFYLSTANMEQTSPCVLTQFVVPRNDGTDYGDYLLENVSTTAIAIDGAGRKWIGTAGVGVYLISEDNMTQVEHFTADNSPLLSNNIESIAVNGSTGEVYFGTDKGLCSYMGDATTPADEMTKDNVYAYPNPVRPDYTGPITVTGLTLNAEVKITTSSGTLVAEGRSTGGTFTWDGCDSEGRRVASGVYMVHTSTSSGDKGTVCKIAIVR